MKKLKTLIIIDIDDTFLPHRTVSVGHKLFWKRFPGISSIRLAFLGAKLYVIKLYREILNKFGSRLGIRMSNEFLISIWANGIIKSKITKKEYELPSSDLKALIYTKIFDLYKRIKAIHPDNHVIAITQSFEVCNSDGKIKYDAMDSADSSKHPLCNVLGIDEFYSNKFLTDKRGIIRSAELIVKHGRDKLRIAQKAVDRLKPKKILLFIDDYEDLELLKLRNLKGVEVVTAFAGKKIRKHTRG